MDGLNEFNFVVRTTDKTHADVITFSRWRNVFHLSSEEEKHIDIGANLYVLAFSVYAMLFINANGRVGLIDLWGNAIF